MSTAATEMDQDTEGDHEQHGSEDDERLELADPYDNETQNRSSNHGCETVQ